MGERLCGLKVRVLNVRFEPNVIDAVWCTKVRYQERVENLQQLRRFWLELFMPVPKRMTFGKHLIGSCSSLARF